MANQKSDKNKNYRKGGRYNKDRKNDKYQDRSEEKDFRGKRPKDRVVGANDPSWYITDPSTLRAVANFPFGNPAGFDVPWTNFTDFAGTEVGDSYAVPGVMAVHFEPTVGYARNSSDPLSMAAQSAYTFIRSANSGAKNYEPADLMVYFLAMDNLFMAYTLMMRAYSTLYSFNVMNRYMPEALFKSQNLDYQSFVGRTADFKAYIDQVAMRISQMALPANMNYFVRHQYLCLNTFTDSSVAKAQFINFVPNHLYMYRGYSDKKGGTLVSMQWGVAPPMTFDVLKEKVEELINSVTTDIDCGIISGDILKAFGSSGLMRCPIMPADFHVVPAHDQLLLLQLHNAMAFGDWEQTFYQTDPQNPNDARVLSSKAVIPHMWARPNSWIVDMPVDEVTPELMIEATRFMHNTLIVDDEMIATDYASELICKFKIYYYMDGAIQENTCFTIMDYDEISPVILQLMSQINTHPPVHLMMFNSEGGLNFSMGRLGQIDNYTPFDLNKLNAMNNMALTAMFAIQEVTKSLYNSR